MMLRRMMMAVGGGAPVAVFDPALTSGSLLISGGGTIVTATANNAGQALSAVAISAGKYYAEFEIVGDVVGSANGAFGAGVKRDVLGLDGYLGGSADEWASWAEGPSVTERSTYTNGARSNAVAGKPTPPIGTRMRIAVDVGVAVWFSRWGESAWIAGDPSTGASPVYALPAGTYRLAVNPRGTGRALRLVPQSEWASTAPAGYNSWGG